MTHRLRTLHDGIMVGVGTALVDDPQLNARYVSSTIPITQPQPIIIDPYLKLSSTCKLIKNYQNNIGKQVLLMVSSRGCNENPEKKKLLEGLGVKIIEISTHDDHLPLTLVLEELKHRGIESLMIEGGSKIIQSCLSSNLFDRLIITTAPMFIGSEGVPAISKAQDIKRLNNVKYITLGNDSVMSAE
ncbi:riboflavin biosynthesis protein RibD domain-containing protein [Mucor mucedo]|uniref:riboflavin biosynthesis protein RibD domain-containing protein n=1 Tax=Mucor mucedo TaxID=29922 RepID=UPI0022200E39|nr:riboflavin biosynthesis protein RibD domain-containing protein [Mucor mucedo]KAI7889331.1 riboflavin biosynthesis protein RibD domain-containing protein [Mucor mucedo]